ncbi:MAG: hypothetical protein NDI82_09220 [Anaeromyxobacteraceae bacterium]|nr:hypothetical protein [Anaeromyxobacteraceae bacterium]
MLPLLAFLLAPLVVVAALLLGAAALLGALVAALLAVHVLLRVLSAAAAWALRLSECGVTATPLAGRDADPGAG